MWSLTDHACGRCFGRVLAREVSPGVLEHLCAECGTAEVGPVEKVCACGVSVDGGRRRLKCMRNPRVSDEVPQQILVRETTIEKSSEQRIPARAVPPAGLL